MIKIVSREQIQRVRTRLARLYGDECDRLVDRFLMMVGRYGVGDGPARDRRSWNERDTVLITYADMVKETGSDDTLRSLGSFCRKYLKEGIGTIHLLPFYPWSSDDGFSVIDYRKVDERYGDWSGVEALSRDFDLMFDMVLNHCSARSSWFDDFVAGIEPARHYFLQMDPKGDYSAVVRPRTSPLLTRTRTRDGEADVWTTFSADQVDLNWQNPEVLFEFLDIFFLYIAKGMRICRMDAVAFIWKTLGTDCLHRPETHEIVKLFRDVAEIVAPDTILLTETNVPHAENVSYFGGGDEAHMVYQFSLPPLLLHGLVTGEASHLTNWARSLAPPPPGCTFFNFTASHDGIGVRPLEGILPEAERDKLVRHVEAAGGKVNARTLSNGKQSPYELNITWYSALAIPDDPGLGAARFMCSQALMLSLRGIPGIYFHSLTATENDLAGLAATGHNRRINRRKWERAELEAHLADPEGVAGNILDSYLKMLRRRARHPAFHPDAPQYVHEVDPELFVHSRIARDRSEVIFCVYNFTAKEKRITNPANSELLKKTKSFYDIISRRTYGSGRKGLKVGPYQAMWLVPK